VTTAVIPCGGRGTRLAAIARDTPKELLPIGGRPLLQWTLEEAAAAGLDRAVVVTSPHKRQLARFLSDRPPVGLSVSIVVQPEPRGLGDAITCARPALGPGGRGGGDVAVLLPDNLFSGGPAIAPVLDARRRTGCAAVLLAEIGAADAATKGATGRVAHRPRMDPAGRGLLQIVALAGKGAREARFDTGGSPSAFTAIGRMVFGPDVFDRLERLRARITREQRVSTELDDVPLLQELAAEGRLVGVPLARPVVFYDVGVPEGYHGALAALT
jgi:UTP--glucose-1-phosphate uridylyltransferase